MSVIEIGRSAERTQQPRRRRFERVAITSVFGPPRLPTTWSGAPNNLASALERHGVEVEAIYPRLTRPQRLRIAAGQVLGNGGRLPRGEDILRSAPAREMMAGVVARSAEQLGVRHILHTGSLDLPALDLLRGVKHYLYCDHNWALALRHRPDAARFGRRLRDEFERLERDSYVGLEHIFTFGTYVRDHLITAYRAPPERVTAVGSGMGAIRPFYGPKDYRRPELLFVAKHYFAEKGGLLLLDAFRIAREARPDLHLTIVGDARSRRLIPDHPGVTVRDRLPWQDLEALFHGATLLVQPMLNDPWGQVYLEALVARTPVIGLNRHGLPEIADNGACGFLVDEADPHALSTTILTALSDPDRLARMGQDGQRRVLATYSWDHVAARIIAG